MKKLDSVGFSVFAGAGSLKNLNNKIQEKNYSSVHILCDENTFTYCLPFLLENCKKIVNPYIIQIPAGEKNKNLKTTQKIWKALIKQRANRKSVLINLGGGVVTDMGAFAASTYMRGIDFIQVPTSLLSMVDASVGGKTGIDFGTLKNMIGTFSAPKLVCVEPAFLQSLSNSEFKSGYAEVLKHALIADKKQFEYLIKIKSSKLKLSEEQIVASITIKNKIVVKDFKEIAERKLLNFGHTLGHAIESCLLTSKHPLLHGEAIFIGMLCESYIALKKNILSAKDFKIIEKVLKGLITLKSFHTKDIKKIIALTRFDKKNEGKEINFTLISLIGKGLINQTANEEEMKESLSYYLSL